MYLLKWCLFLSLVFQLNIVMMDNFNICSDPTAFGRQILLIGATAGGTHKYLLITKSLAVYQFDESELDEDNVRLDLSKIVPSMVEQVFPNLANNLAFDDAHQNNRLEHALILYSGSAQNLAFVTSGFSAEPPDTDKLPEVTYDVKKSVAKTGKWTVDSDDLRKFIKSSTSAWVSLGDFSQFAITALGVQRCRIKLLKVGSPLSIAEIPKGDYYVCSQTSKNDDILIKSSSECSVWWTEPMLSIFLSKKKAFFMSQQSVISFEKQNFPGHKEFIQANDFSTVKRVTWKDFFACSDNPDNPNDDGNNTNSGRAESGLYKSLPIIVGTIVLGIVLIVISVLIYCCITKSRKASSKHRSHQQHSRKQSSSVRKSHSKTRKNSSRKGSSPKATSSRNRSKVKHSSSKKKPSSTKNVSSKKRSSMNALSKKGRSSSKKA